MVVLVRKGAVMAESIIQEINNCTSYKFDVLRNKVVNLKDSEDTDIDEFLNIQFLLDCNRVMYYFKKNFEIQIVK